MHVHKVDLLVYTLAFLVYTLVGEGLFPSVSSSLNFSENLHIT
jgi:hypothetical protein